MNKQLAEKATINHFLEMAKDAERNLYLANTEVPSFTWTHDTVEGDLIYGAIQFHGYPERFPTNAYLWDNGENVMIGASVFHTSASPTGKAHPQVGPVYLAPPLPSQFPVRSPHSELPKMVKMTNGELALADTFQERMENAGFRITGHRSGLKLSMSYRQRQLKGCLDFELRKGDVHAWVSIRKMKDGGIFSRPKWSVIMQDDSNRRVQPHGWGEDGILISPGATTIALERNLESPSQAFSSLLQATDKLVSRNRSETRTGSNNKQAVM